MKKNGKILIASAAGIVVLGGAAAALLLTMPATETESDIPTEDTSATVYSYDTDEVSKLTVKNADGEYAINRLGVEKWGIDDIKEEYANSSFYSSAMKTAAALTADAVVEQDGSDISKYGFDNPTATFTLDFKDGAHDSITCTVGSENEGAGGWYLKKEGGDDIYLVKESDISFCMRNKLDFVSLSGFIEAFDEENDVLSRVRVSRKDMDTDLVLDKLPDKDPDRENTNIYVGYTMSSHNNTLADDEKANDVLFGLFNLAASSAAAISPDSEQLKEYGLDDPFCSASMVLNDEVVKLDIGNAVYGVNEETGKATDEITGYYGMLHGRDIVYIFPPDTLPWVTVTPDDILYKQFLTPYIYYVDKVNIVIGEDKTEHVLDIEGDDTETGKFTLDGEEANGLQVKTFYQYLLSCYAEKTYIDDLTDDNKFIASFEYIYRDKADGTEGTGVDKVELYESENDRTCIIVVNGQVRYKVRRMYGERFASNFNALETGGDIMLEY